LLSNHRVWLVTIILLSFLLIEIQSNPIIVTASSQVIFDQTGVGSDFNGFVLIVDGVSYNRTSMPVVFLWEIGSTHAFSFVSFSNVSSGKRYSWNNTAGLSTLQSDVIVVSDAGNIIANYTTQFFLTLSTNPPLITSPSGKGWYDANTYATISTNALINDTIRPDQKRYVFREWITTGTLNVTDPTSTNTTVFMDNWKTVKANYTTQYYWTWDQEGIGPDFAGTVWSLDGQNYGVEDLPVSSWYDKDTVVNFTITPSCVVTPNEKQYAFSYNTGTLTGSSKPHHNHLTAGQYMIVIYGYLTCVFKTQYYLNVTSAYGNSTSISGWYDANSNITLNVISPLRDANGTSYECTGWDGDGNIPSSGSETTVTFTLTTQSSITWNWLKSGTQIRADINGDGVVNILDVVRITAVYGMTSSSPNWDPYSDIAQPYGKIDILDVVACTSHYAEKYLG